MRGSWASQGGDYGEELEAIGGGWDGLGEISMRWWEGWLEADVCVRGVCGCALSIHVFVVLSICSLLILYEEYLKTGLPCLFGK